MYTKQANKQQQNKNQKTKIITKQQQNIKPNIKANHYADIFVMKYSNVQYCLMGLLPILKVLVLFFQHHP